MVLGDGSWLSLEASEWRTLPFPLIDFLIRVVPISTVCLLLSLWVIRGFMRPITRLAAAAERLGIDGDVSILQETGAPEMRAAARAFNEMQLRLRRLIDDRTQMLAAISHDLKTPITRLRLRAEFIEEPALQEKMLADLAEMEAIVASTLAFARSDARSEGSEAVDLADMLQSLAEARADSGAAVGYEGPAHLTIRARPVALRRALSNLIDNAIKYGTSAQIALRLEERQAVVEIADEGPGIAAEQMELVFRPYYRLEGSRSRETGGVGLGLSIARAVIRAEGGEIALANRPEGGLCARVHFAAPNRRAGLRFRHICRGGRASSPSARRAPESRDRSPGHGGIPICPCAAGRDRRAPPRPSRAPASARATARRPRRCCRRRSNGFPAIQRTSHLSGLPLDGPSIAGGDVSFVSGRGMRRNSLLQARPRQYSGAGSLLAALDGPEIGALRGQASDSLSS